MEWYEKALTAHREVGNRALEGVTLLQIGFVYVSQHKYDQALETRQQALPIFRELGLRWHESLALSQIGNTYILKDDKERAVEFLQQSLAVQREINDSTSQLQTLGLIMLLDDSKARNLSTKGLHSQARTQATRVIKLAQEVLTFAREEKNPEWEAEALSNLGSAYRILYDNDKAIEFLQQAVNIARQIKALQAESNALSALGVIYSFQGDDHKVIELNKR